jgi:tetratricopeptide (TPR) repeat protein
MAYPILVYGGVFCLLGIILVIFVFLKKRKSQPQNKLSTFSFPLPSVNEEKINKIEGELLEFGFAFVSNYEKSNFGLWPSFVKLYIHRNLPIFTEVSVLPNEDVQVQYITLFPAGSLMTTVGERQLTFRFMASRDLENWETGSLSSVFETHQKYMKDYEAKTVRPPLPATEEGYLDLLALQKQSIHRQLQEEKLVPRTILDYLVLGYLFLNQGRVMEALEMFQGAVNMDPDKPFLYRLAGRISLYVQNFEAASQYFYEAVDLDSENKEGYLWLSEALLQLNKKKEAFAILKKAHERFPKDTEFSLRFGIVATEVGELEEARASLEPLDGTTSPSKALFQALANLYNKLGDSKKAGNYSRLAKVFAKQKEDWKELQWNRERP